MGIYVGDTEIKGIYLGDTPVKKVYLGDTKIRPSTTPITTAGIYHNATLGLISLSSDGSTWITIADKNLGATTVYNNGDALSEANCGKFYQWGNNYGFPFSGPTSTTTTKVDASTYGPGNYYSGSSFYASNGNWDSSNNDNLRGGTTNTVEARRGPCNIGFHIPSKNELDTLKTLMYTTFGLTGNVYKSYLKIPMAGQINTSGSVQYQGLFGFIWSSDAEASHNGVSCFIYNTVTVEGVTSSYGYSIRPFANTPTQPDTSRTKLY